MFEFNEFNKNDVRRIKPYHGVQKVVLPLDETIEISFDSSLSLRADEKSELDKMVLLKTAYNSHPRSNNLILINNLLLKKNETTSMQDSGSNYSPLVTPDHKKEMAYHPITFNSQGEQKLVTNPVKEPESVSFQMNPQTSEGPEELIVNRSKAIKKALAPVPFHNEDLSKISKVATKDISNFNTMTSYVHNVSQNQSKSSKITKKTSPQLTKDFASFNLSKTKLSKFNYDSQNNFNITQCISQSCENCQNMKKCIVSLSKEKMDLKLVISNVKKTISQKIEADEKIQKRLLEKAKIEERDNFYLEKQEKEIIRLRKLIEAAVNNEVSKTNLVIGQGSNMLVTSPLQVQENLVYIGKPNNCASFC